MPFVRIAIMTPLPGQQELVEKCLDDLVRYHASRPGIVAAYRLDATSTGDEAKVGRLSIWDSVAAANLTASQEHDLALQSQLKVLVHDSSHEEFSFPAVKAEAAR